MDERSTVGAGIPSRGPSSHGARATSGTERLRMPPRDLASGRSVPRDLQPIERRRPVSRDKRGSGSDVEGIFHDAMTRTPSIPGKHIQFIRGLTLFHHFTIERLMTSPLDVFTEYFEEGRVVGDSDSEFLVVVMSGQCRVICKIEEPIPKTTEERKIEEDLKSVFPLIAEAKMRKSAQIRRRCRQTLEWEIGELRDVMRANIMMGNTHPDTILHYANEKKLVDRGAFKHKRLSRIYDEVERKRMSRMTSSAINSSRFVGETVVEEGLAGNEPQPGPVRSQTWMPARTLADRPFPPLDGTPVNRSRDTDPINMNRLPCKEESKSREGDGPRNKVNYVQVATIGTEGVFGLEFLFHTENSKLILASEGADCIMFSKSLFLRECNSEVLRHISHQILRYPSLLYVKEKLKERKQWETFKQRQLKDLLPKGCVGRYRAS